MLGNGTADQASQGSSVGVGDKEWFMGVVRILWGQRQGGATLAHGTSGYTARIDEHGWFCAFDGTEIPVEERTRCWGARSVGLSITFISAL